MSPEITEHDLQNERRMARMEAMFTSIQQNITDNVLPEIKALGKRTTALEKKNSYFAGVMFGAGSMGGVATTLLLKFLQVI